MSHGQKPDPTANYNAALTAASTKSPLQTKLEGIASSDVDLINKGDYTKLPHDIFFDFADPAQQAKQRSLQSNAHGQGVAGLAEGSANPTVLALNRQNIADQNAQDDAQAYEQAVGQGAQRAFGAAENLDQSDQARRLSVLSSTVGPYQQKLAKPGWFDRLLQGAGVAASGVGAYYGAQA